MHKGSRGWSKIIKQLLQYKDILIMKEWNQYINNKKSLQVKTKTKAFPQLYIYYGYPIYEIPRASVYWNVIKAQCYLLH